MAAHYFCRIFEGKTLENTAINAAVPDFCQILEAKMH